MSMICSTWSTVYVQVRTLNPFGGQCGMLMAVLTKPHGRTDPSGAPANQHVSVFFAAYRERRSYGLHR